MQTNLDNLITVNTRKCVACRTCELECTLSHSESKELFSAIFEDPKPQKRIFVENVGEVNFPLQCRHCEDPPCKNVCPTDAISKLTNEDPVLIDNKKCIGCKYCLIACPFGVAVLHKDDNKIIKCDLCTELEDNATPSCVKNCPTKALEFIPSKELTKRKRREFMVEFLDNNN